MNRWQSEVFKKERLHPQARQSKTFIKFLIKVLEINFRILWKSLENIKHFL